jgi:predicted dehydrogenase
MSASSKKIRVGILGAGSMGQRHAAELRMRPQTEIVAICNGPRDAAAITLKEKTGASVARVFTDFDRMLEECPFDALYVCLPPFAHDGQVEKAVSRGIHLFLEKPIALSLERGESMVAAIEKNGVVSQMGYHLRFRQSVEAFRSKILDGSAGRPTLFSGRFWGNILGPAWWVRADQSGGQVWEQAIHIYDLAMHLFGEPLSVTGAAENLCHRNVDGYTIEDTSAGLVRFRNGALASITGSNCALPTHCFANWSAVCEHSVLDVRTTGQFWIDPDESTIFTHHGEERALESFKEDGNTYGAESDDFLNAIQTGSRTRSPARDGLNSLRLVSAVLKSASLNGKTIAWQETAGVNEERAH